MNLVGRSRHLFLIIFFTMAAVSTAACGAQERLDDVRQRAGEALVQDRTETPNPTVGANSIVVKFAWF